MKAFSSKQFLGIMDMVLFDEDIPKYIKEDVSNRVHDWCSRGGKETDHYITMQYEYLLRIKEFVNRNKAENNKK